MTAALLLLLVGEVSAPLGPYARPGIALPLIVRNETLLDVEGWPYAAAASPLTFVHPPAVPCTIRDKNGKELLRLEAVPEKTLLVGVEGPAPPDYAGRIPRAEGWQVIVVPGVETAALGGHRGCLELFDRFVTRADRAAEFARPAPLAPAPRRNNRAPEVYDSIHPQAGASRALGLARLVGVGAAWVLAMQVLLAWRGRLSRRFNIAALTIVALSGAFVGGELTRLAYDPLDLARIDIEIRERDGTLRSWSYVCYTALGPGGKATPEADWVPLHYRAAGAPWWSGPDREMAIEKGVMRLFLVRDRPRSWRMSDPPTVGRADLDLSPLARFLRPPGDWIVRIEGWGRVDAPVAQRGARISFRPRN